uniref:Uncharacterized protein n=1 Tax=Anguilla anguilla TaxID=7936 RepID=A0A0E9RGB5_ANGAN
MRCWVYWTARDTQQLPFASLPQTTVHSEFSSVQVHRRGTVHL